MRSAVFWDLQMARVVYPIMVLLTLLTGAPASGQSNAPNLTRVQRAALQAVVSAVDRATHEPDTTAVEWQVHLLRASDGSHYVAFSILDPVGVDATRPVTLYVRLATKREAGVTAERSAVADWLAGRRNSPPPPQRGIAFGEMPTYGAGAVATRGPGPQSLALLEMERERARERREARERERKSQLEGAGGPQPPNPLLPFEDFDVAAVAAADKNGTLALQRSLTAAPGVYDLFVAWADPTAKDPAPAHVVKRTVTLPIASTSDFALSSVIVADDVGVRDTPFAANQQTAHPYSIGTANITPARDHTLTTDERLALVVQVINARPTANGKPDVALGFRLFRVMSARQEQVGTLNPQIYNQTTLPVDFDLMKGHPIFAAVAVPLRTFKRGDYRLQILADDRIAGANTTAETTFTVIATPAALLADAPALAQAFRRDAILQPAAVGALVSALRPSAPSAALTSALDAARAQRFVDLVRDDSVPQEEHGTRIALRALALYALGDTGMAVMVPLRLALQLGAPAPAVQLLIGAAQALQGNDRDAVSAWQTALDSGLDRSIVAPLLVDACLRLGDGARAVDAMRAVQTNTGDLARARRLAAAYVADRRAGDAVALLDAQLLERPDDLDAQWLLLHALFAGFVHGQGPGSDPAGQDRIKRLADRYAAAGGPHAALAAEWARVIR